MAARGFVIDIDTPVFQVGSVVAWVASALLLERFEPPPSAPVRPLTPKQRGRQRRNVAIGVGVLVATAALVGGLFLNAWGELAVRRATNVQFPRFADLSLALACAAAMALSRIALLPLFLRVGDAMLPRTKWPAAERRARVDRFAGQLWKLLYHSAVTVAPLVILHGQGFWPPWSSASDMRLVFENYPHVPQLPWLREFYLFQIGYYIHATQLTLTRTRDRPNFVQMCTHHAAVLGLLVVSYFLQNNVRLGTIYGWVHDVCDVPVCLSRLTVDLPHAAPTAFFYATLMVSWVYFRLFIYPVRTVWAGVVQCFRDGWVRWEDAYGWTLTSPLLCTLVVLHIIWFRELVQMGSVYLRTGKREDTDQNHATDDTATDNSSSKPHAH